MANQKPWVPYMNTKDCSQGFCSLYCPQWCYIIFPPPPPYEFSDDNSGPNFSPIVIAIIGILASAFLLVSYYAIISKYCKDRDSSSRRENHHFPGVESEENQDPFNHQPNWDVSSGNVGLDEALIKSIKVLKFKKEENGLIIEGADCSVCLSEFQDDESLRLLPKCGHAFHVMCIDTWLKSHSNCPLCRANITFVTPPIVSQAVEIRPLNESPFHSNPEIGNATFEEDIEMGIREGDSRSNIAKSPNRQGSDLENSAGEQIRRSVSMDGINQGCLSIADVLLIDQDEEEDRITEESKSSNRNRVLRSFSSGRFLFSSKGGRGRNVVIPL
ncbi:hypothetical protein ACH5RR_040542 [Cinchona calisaya]|uniref:RING-type E3 ubiquitin transferase n=1 Tax=Cinchona calisaya TaxID=153742 RepID=A0ABD2XUM8_9GENT